MEGQSTSCHSGLYKRQSETSSAACLKRRRERVCEIRKRRLEEILQNRRHIDTEQFLATASDEDIPNPLVSISRVQHLLRGGLGERLEAFAILSQAMLENEHQSIHQLAELHLIPILTEIYLSSDGDLQQKVGWILLNMARIPENFIHYTGQLDVLRSMFQVATVCYEAMIVADSMETVLPQLFSALGLFAGKHIGNAMYIMNCPSVAELILSVLRNHSRTSKRTLSSCAWLCAQLFRYAETDPGMYESEIQISIIDAMTALLRVDDLSILIDSILCFMNAVWSEQLVQASFTCGALKRLVELSLLESDASTYALHTISNVIENYGQYTDALINEGLVEVIYLALASPNRAEDGAHILSCICAEGRDQIAKLFKENRMIDRVYEVFTNATFDKRKEICAAIGSVCEMGSNSIKEALVRRGFLEPLCFLLDSTDVNTVICVLIALDSLLELGESQGVDTIREAIESLGGLGKLVQLHDHENIDIMVKSQEIYDRYFAHLESEYHEDFAEVQSTMEDLLNLLDDESTNSVGKWKF